VSLNLAHPVVRSPIYPCAHINRSYTTVFVIVKFSLDPEGSQLLLRLLFFFLLSVFSRPY